MSKQPKCESYEDLENKFKTYITDEKDIELIKKAYDYASKKLYGQKRLTGDDAITHPLGAAYILTSINADAATLSAALLCDITDDDNAIKLDEMFGKEVMSLVRGVSKINKLSFTGDSESAIVNQRKILVGLTEDVRVIIIKLACRLHNMQTLFVLPEKKQKETAKETLEILTPIAHRLGINTIKTKLEEYSLRYLKPDEYYSIVEKLNATKTERDASVAKMIESVSELLNSHGIKHEIKGRAKSIYSIYKKLDSGKRFSEIFDLLALRVFVDTEQDCYQALGIIHSKFKPKPNRFKDYIAMPKTNMYQSLHTTVFGVDGQLFEIQIRTYEMDKIAEYGIASHWSYKEAGSVKASLQNEMEQKLQFFRSIMELKSDENTDESFVKSVKEEVLNSMIYVFTPAGDVIELPKGATPIDFAYKVHSGVGNTMTGALVNSVMVSLDYELKDNDIVKIITNKNTGTPSYEWLKIAKTNQAKNKIKNYLSKSNKEENIKRGEELLHKCLKKEKVSLNDFLDEENLENVFKTLKVKTLNEIYASIGSGSWTAENVYDQLYNQPTKEEKLFEQAKKAGQKTSKSDNLVNVSNIANMKVTLAACCNPVPGDEITGYITKGNGVSIHRMTCPNIAESDERLISVSWNVESAKLPTMIVVYTNIGQDKLAQIISLAANHDVGVQKVINHQNSEVSAIELTIVVKNKEHLLKFINALKASNDIVTVERHIK